MILFLMFLGGGRYTTHILSKLRSIKLSPVTKTGISQPTITCSKLTIETLEQGVKYVQS